MEDRKKNLFRTKSIEKIESPETMNDYLQVTSPGVWIILIAVITFLIGTCIWGIFGRINSSTIAAVISENGKTVCLVPENALNSVIETPSMNINGNDYELAPATLEPEVISETTNVYWILAGDLAVGDIIYKIPLTQTLPDGVYSGTIITETLSPFSLLLN